MSRLNVFLCGFLVIGGIVALILQAWAIGAVVLLVGGVGLFAEIRQNRRAGYIPMEGRNADADGHDAFKSEVLAVRQVRDGHSWIGAGPVG